MVGFGMFISFSWTVVIIPRTSVAEIRYVSLNKYPAFVFSEKAQRSTKVRLGFVLFLDEPHDDLSNRWLGRHRDQLVGWLPEGWLIVETGQATHDGVRRSAYVAPDVTRVAGSIGLRVEIGKS